MIAAEAILSRLEALLHQGVLARSSCGRQFLATVVPLVQSGVIAEERSGAGRRLVVTNSAALRKFIEERYPRAQPVEGSSSREAGVALFRNSKSYKSDTAELVSIRAWSEHALGSGAAANPDGSPNGKLAVDATAAFGAFCFLTSARGSTDLRLCGPWALVENPAVFQHFDRTGAPAPAVLYGGGRASRQLIAWIRAHTGTGFSLLHLPDYDPTGLCEHERLLSHFPDSIRLYIPSDLEQRFARFANPLLLQRPKTQRMLAELRNSSHAQIQAVVGLIDRHNAGLEQEALLLG